MFGNLFGALGNLGEIKTKAKETRDNLGKTLVSEKTEDGIEVVVTAMKQIESIKIPSDIPNEELAEKLTAVLNDALTKASEIQETELKGLAKKYLPNIPGLDGLLG